MISSFQPDLSLLWDIYRTRSVLPNTGQVPPDGAVLASVLLLLQWSSLSESSDIFWFIRSRLAWRLQRNKAQAFKHNKMWVTCSARWFENPQLAEYKVPSIPRMSVSDSAVFAPLWGLAALRTTVVARLDELEKQRHNVRLCEPTRRAAAIRLPALLRDDTWHTAGADRQDLRANERVIIEITMFLIKQIVLVVVDNFPFRVLGFFRRENYIAAGGSSK